MSQKAWFNAPGYLQGIFWMTVVCCVSNSNDILIKYVGTRLSGAEIAFFRFFFSTLVLLPFMVRQGKGAFITRYPKAHFVRALLLFLAMAPWCYGVAALPLTLATTLALTTPFFVLPLARIFLKEQVSWQRWVATLLGFLGIVIALHPSGADFNLMALALVAATIMFATLDIINKKLLTEDETLLSMLFYSALGTAVLGFIPAVLTWQTPTVSELFFLLLLGGGASGILFCLLKACAATEVSALQPFKYVELILSGIFGLLIFQELPAWSTVLGAIVIIPSTLYIAIHETKLQTRKARLREREHLQQQAAA